MSQGPIKIAFTTSSNLTYCTDGYHFFDPVLDEYGNDTGHAICNRIHGSEMCTEVRWFTKEGL